MTHDSCIVAMSWSSPAPRTATALPSFGTAPMRTRPRNENVQRWSVTPSKRDDLTSLQITSLPMGAVLISPSIEDEMALIALADSIAMPHHIESFSLVTRTDIRDLPRRQPMLFADDIGNDEADDTNW